MQPVGAMAEVSDGSRRIGGGAGRDLVRRAGQTGGQGLQLPTENDVVQPQGRAEAGGRRPKRQSVADPGRPKEARAGGGIGLADDLDIAKDGHQGSPRLIRRCLALGVAEAGRAGAAQRRQGQQTFGQRPHGDMGRLIAAAIANGQTAIMAQPVAPVVVALEGGGAGVQGHEGLRALRLACRNRPGAVAQGRRRPNAPSGPRGPAAARVSATNAATAGRGWGGRICPPT